MAAIVIRARMSERDDQSRHHGGVDGHRHRDWRSGLIDWTGCFTMFSQADAASSPAGLAARAWVWRSANGSLSKWAAVSPSNPESGLGSTFVVTLRLPVTEPVPEALTAPTDVTGAFERRVRKLGRSMRILFAEDSLTNQFVALPGCSSGFSVQVDVVGDGSEAVHGASSFLYDVICMDMRMPEMDGLAATRAIRALGGSLATIPDHCPDRERVPEDRAMAACHGRARMTAFLAKPVRKGNPVGGVVGRAWSR